MTIATLGLAFLAGLISILSPCVLPLVPIVVGTAASRHRLGPVALAAGLAVSFVTIGVGLATVGFAIGLDTTMIRSAAAVVMILIGATLLMPALQERVAIAAGPAAGWASQRMGAVDQDGWKGQFVVGVLLGAVWTPCVGPTLGAASALAAQGESLGAVAAIMVTFAVGAALPLLIIGTLSREAVMKLRGRLAGAGSTLKMVLGAILVLVGVMVVSGLDKTVEAHLVAVMPDWLTRFTTAF